MPENRRWRSVCARLALVAFGTLMGLALLEGAMRAAGTVLRAAQAQRNQRALNRKHDVRILCLGESTTAGIGDHASYPELLEQILNAQGIGTTFAVVNQGRIGATTNEIVASLEEDLQTYAPDVVVVMMGINDGGKTHAWGDVIAPGSNRWYGSFRLYKVYRLARVALEGSSTDPPTDGSDRVETGAPRPFVPAPEQVPDALREAIRLIDRHEYARAEPMLDDLLGEDPGLAKAYVELARLYRETDRAKEAHQLLLRGVDAVPAPAAGLYGALGWSHFQAGDVTAAVNTHRFLIDSVLEPANVWDQTYYRVVLADIFEADGQVEQAVEVLREIIERVDPANDIAYRYLIELYERHDQPQRAAELRAAQQRLRDDYVNPMTRQNYHTLRAAVRARGIPLVAVQYPGRRWGSLARLLDEDPDVLYVDNAFFKELAAVDGYDSLYLDRFAGDFGHLTETGNRHLARSVARAIVEVLFGRPFADDPRRQAAPIAHPQHG